MELVNSVKCVARRRGVVKLVVRIMAKANPLKNKVESEEFDGGQELTAEEEQFLAETSSWFEEVWKNAKDKAKDFSKKDLARHMFVSGALMFKRYIDEEMEESLHFMKENPETMKEVEKIMENSSLWSKKTFAETFSPEEMKEKEKTMHMKHDQDMNYNCKQCNGKMSAHNRDWHAGLCDGCFDQAVDDADEDEEEDDQSLQHWIK